MQAGKLSASNFAYIFCVCVCVFVCVSASKRRCEYTVEKKSTEKHLERMLKNLDKGFFDSYEILNHKQNK